MRDIHKEVIALLEKYGNHYKQALKENKRLEYLYALSVLRENLLEWYEFKKDASLLQVGADYGALTELFARRVSRVTVLDESEEALSVVRKRFENREHVGCVRGELKEYAARVKRQEIMAEDGAVRGYDTVTLIGSLKEPFEEQLRAARELCLPGGTLILAACNRFGMKYFAGAKKDEYSISSNELRRLLPDGAYYYPMPDYRLPSVIYSEKYPPKKGDLTGMPAVYDYPEYLLMDVGEAFDAVCEDGQFENFANSFLIIWKKGE